MSSKFKKIIVFLLVGTLLITSLAGGLAVFLQSSSHSMPKNAVDIVKGNTYSVTNLSDASTSKISFDKDGCSFMWIFDFAGKSTYKKGKYTVYNGSDIIKMFNSEKDNKQFAPEELNAIKSGAQAFVDEGLVNNIADVVYIEVNDVVDMSNATDPFNNTLVFFGYRTDVGLNMKEVFSENLYTFVVE